MSLKTVLLRTVRDVAGNARDELSQLEAMKRDLLQKLADVEIGIAEIEASLGRADSYSSAEAQNELCPWCFVDEDIQHQVKAIPSDTDVDLFRCGRCLADFEDANP